MALIPKDERNLTFFEHLEELRTRLIRCFLAVALGCVVGWFFSEQAIDFLIRPVQESGLLPSQELVLQWDVQEDGSLRLRNPGAALAAQAEQTAAGEEARKVTREQYYRPGAETPSFEKTYIQKSGIIYLRPMDPFMVRVKVTLALGLLLALPVILYQVWAFIAPGLLPHERRWAFPLGVSAMVLFPGGAAFAYYLLAFALLFLAEFASSAAYTYNNIVDYLSFALTTMLAFGVLFELPLVVLIATRLGLISVETLAAKRKYVFLGLVTLCAVVTPTGDPFTLAAVTVPLYVLFEISLVISRMAGSAAVAAVNVETS